MNRLRLKNSKINICTTVSMEVHFCISLVTENLSIVFHYECQSAKATYPPISVNAR